MNFNQFREKYEKIEVLEFTNSVCSSPVVSVCVQTYNHVNYIATCLDSILSQEVDFDYEILIGDDDSNDGTREICIEYAKKFPNKIRLFLHKRENNIIIDNKPSGRFNFFYLLNMSKGRYIALCEGDDFWKDNFKLKKQVNFLEFNPSYVLTGHDATYVNEFGKSTGESKLLPQSRNSCSKYDLQKGFWVLTLTSCFRRVEFEFPHGFEKVAGGDTFLFSYLGQFGHYKFMPNVENSAYRIHEGGVSSTLSDAEKEHVKKVKFNFLKNYYSSRNEKSIAQCFDMDFLDRKMGLEKSINKSSKLNSIFLKIKLVSYQLAVCSLPEILFKSGQKMKFIKLK